MVKIRMARFGRKKDPFYRIIAIEEGRKNKGRSLENLGYWYPKKGRLEIDRNRVSEWMAKGAVASLKVKSLLEKQI